MTQTSWGGAQFSTHKAIIKPVALSAASCQLTARHAVTGWQPQNRGRLWHSNAQGCQICINSGSLLVKSHPSLRQTVKSTYVWGITHNSSYIPTEIGEIFVHKSYGLESCQYGRLVRFNQRKKCACCLKPALSVFSFGYRQQTLHTTPAKAASLLEAPRSNKNSFMCWVVEWRSQTVCQFTLGPDLAFASTPSPIMFTERTDPASPHAPD